MTFGTILILAFWAFFTVRFGFNLKHARKMREAAHETKLSANSGDETRIKKAARLTRIMKYCGYALKVVGWIEIALLTLIVIWIIFLIGAVISGTFVIFGYPI